RGAREHHQRRRLIGLTGPRENLAPLHFGAAEHGRNELLHLIAWQSGLGRAGRGLRLLRRTAEARQDLGTANEVKRIDAQRPPNEPQENDGAEPETAGAAQAGRSLAALIFDPVAARQLIKTHGGAPMLRSATWRAGEAVEHAFDAVEMTLLDIAADLEAIPEHGCTNAVVHHAELLAQIREVLHLRGLAGGHTRGAASPAKDVAQDLAEHVAAGRLRCRRRGSRLSAWRRHRSALTARQGERSAFDDHGLDAPLAKALLQFAQDVSEKVAARSRLTARARRH